MDAPALDEGLVHTGRTYPVDAHRIGIKVEIFTAIVSDLTNLPRIEAAFVDRLLTANAEFLEEFAEAVAPLIVGNIIDNDGIHGVEGTCK